MSQPPRSRARAFFLRLQPMKEGRKEKEGTQAAKSQRASSSCAVFTYTRSDTPVRPGDFCSWGEDRLCACV